MYKESASRISHNIKRDEVMTTQLELRLKYQTARQARNASKDNDTWDYYQKELEDIIQQLADRRKK